MNTGPSKHFVKDGSLACVLAWGENVFTNRQDVGGHLRILEEHNFEYDAELKGEQTIRTGVMALSRDSSEAGITRAPNFSIHPCWCMKWQKNGNRKEIPVFWIFQRSI